MTFLQNLLALLNQKSQQTYQGIEKMVYIKSLKPILISSNYGDGKVLGQPLGVKTIGLVEVEGSISAISDNLSKSNSRFRSFRVCGIES